MEINELQKKCANMVSIIDKKLAINHDDSLSVLHLSEELGEVAREILNPKLKRDNINIKNLEEELADIIFFISKIAENNKIDLEKAIIKKTMGHHTLKVFCHS
ncbi:MAG: MazG nucleotide pyrophosphohydrolase domain-containing protein [Nanoarchaeota archaeon]|nr:MazG nucleotide pyrophosphohydrolase domain-containing protein [Nanoarchaeota archaeon]